MFYMIITLWNLVWFLLSMITAMLVAWATFTPTWLLGPIPENYNNSIAKHPSVGIYMRCKTMNNRGFHCGRFDLDGFATDNSVYPLEWKFALIFISLGMSIISLTVVMALITCCRQSAFGKSIHNLTACAQVIAGISVMMALFSHAIGWSADRVQKLCGADAEPFIPGNCTFGRSFYCAVIGAILAFICALLSRKAESSHMRTHIKRRIEDGDRLVCIV